MSAFRLAVPALMLFCASAWQAQAGEVTVTITNLTPGLHFTPLLVAVHDSTAAVFTAGQPASAALRKMAECGDISELVMSLPMAAKVENPAAGLLGPGKSTTAMLMNSATQTRLSIVGMLLPTNDGFVGVNGWQIPTVPGTYTIALNAYDAGTEANTEIRQTAACAPGVAGMPVPPPLEGEVGHNGTGIPGAAAEGYVHIHRNNLGDLDTNAGVSDVQAGKHRWLNPVARATVVVK